MFAKSNAKKAKQKSPKPFGFELFTGPSEVTRTPNLDIPNVAPYQLSYTRIFSYAIIPRARRKSKTFLSVVDLQARCRLYHTPIHST